MRNFNSLGNRPGNAATRLSALTEVTRTSTGLIPGTSFTSSLIGEYSPHPWVSFGLQPQYLVVDEDDPAAPLRQGLGNTRAFVRLTPHGDKLVHRVLTYSLTASFPTRTIRFTADPGKTWGVSPTVIYSRTYGKPFWQVLGIATLETRPAGTSIDLSAGAQAGVRLANGKLTPAVGALVDVRAAALCTQVDGPQRYCAAGRATEAERQTGATRIASVLGLSYSFTRWGLLAATLQLPLTPKRDFDISGSLLVQFSF